ncbi:hypothetical protein QYE76_012117 [Lolium multiflorum]|uniref:Uncharacterized protein n=1 Tax=Lolium multiflorum TaxID=4521 RepID=A0AAD8X4M9_LOLMU|nr:hypothetical protein QYE76_012117 [Lolium multiflorum]
MAMKSPPGDESLSGRVPEAISRIPRDGIRGGVSKIERPTSSSSLPRERRHTHLHRSPPPTRVPPPQSAAPPSSVPRATAELLLPSRALASPPHSAPSSHIHHQGAAACHCRRAPELGTCYCCSPPPPPRLSVLLLAPPPAARAAATLPLPRPPVLLLLLALRRRSSLLLAPFARHQPWELRPPPSADAPATTRYFEVDRNGDGQKRQTTIAKNILRYLPVLPRIQRLFMTEDTAQQMRWAVEGNRYTDKMIHPSDGTAWKNFVKKFPLKAGDPRSVAVAISTDGFNPYGPKYPGKNMNVYLEPLVDDLVRGWEGRGIRTYDASKKEYFDIAAAIAKPRGQESLFRHPAGRGSAPEGFSIDTAAISTAIFITCCSHEEGVVLHRGSGLYR